MILKYLNNIQIHEGRFFFDISSDLPYLEGHFPEQPIIPAFGIVEISTALIREYALKRSQPLAQIVNGKFLQVIRPETPIQIQYRIKSEGLFDIEWLQKNGNDFQKSAQLDLAFAKT